MITALSTPASGRVLPDSNNTVIKIQSSNGEGYYFRAKIYINAVLFDTQGWSRSDAYTASKDLKKLFNAYFETQFPEPFTNLLQEQFHLERTVKIDIEEYNIATGEVSATLDLPPFVVFYTFKPTAFDDTVRITFVGMDAPVMVVSATGKVAFSFFVNADHEVVSVELRNDQGDFVHGLSKPGVKGKRFFLYQFDLADADISYNTLYFTAKAMVGTHNAVTMTFRVNRLPDHPFKEIAFRNNYGFYLYAYHDGELEESDGYSRESFEELSGSDVVYEVNEEATYTLNSGSYTANEKEVLRMIANSPDIRLRTVNEWLTLTPDTKKINFFKDRQHAYSSDFAFKLKKDAAVANTGFITIETPQPDMVITGHSVSGNTVTVTFVFNNGFAPVSIHLQYRPTITATWFSIPISSPSGMLTFNISSGSYYIRLRDPGNPSNVSNQITVTV